MSAPDRPRPSTMELLRMLAGISTERVPAGWHSSAQIMAAANISRGHVNRVLTTMRDSGLILETRRFKIQCPGRGPYPVPHYKLTREACEALGLTPPD